MADITKIKYGSNVYDIKDANAARQEQADWNTNNGVKNLAKYSTMIKIESGNFLVVPDGGATNDFNAPPGEYILSSIFSITAPNGAQLQIAHSDSTITTIPGVFYPQANVKIEKKFSITKSAIGFRIYCAVSGVQANEIMIRPAYIEDSTFEPYAMSNVELTQKVTTYSRNYSPSTSDYEAANITEGILTTYAAGLAGKSDGSFCVLRTYSMDTPSIGTSKRIQIAEFADGTRKTRTYNNNAWSAWV